jgi:prephenate dehydrogenase
MRIAVIGVGLIGGSIGLAARERLHAETVGFDLDAGALSRARTRGAITHVAASPEEAVEDADACFIAVPVGALPELVERVLDRAPRQCVISDVGSTKRGVVAAIDDPRFIGGHPMTGAETAGVEHARGDLFDGSVWFITPGPQADYGVVFALTELIAQLGATPLGMTAEAHDALMADISQLPHVLANVLIGETAARHASGDGQIWPVGPSFRDATRVAGANTAIWTDIYMSNRDALGEALDGVITRLSEVRAMLARGDAAGLSAWNDAAAAARRGVDMPPPLAGIARTGPAQ